ncbi:MAG TPA: DedA family protein [Oscillatoriales cyanobacterium M59_W2019_021]|nr:MAG: DedA family protein [Cyanobacteria bacterium J055]HIK31662.1 DedA family protein [Oscillatoriales cyanobacterium M4454_W2019_049]HIK50361.1 DedA family protein [Oscillatoriales cyanobacterium M59_W2019_021]
MVKMGYVGIALLMFLENLFPPIPSELIMPLAGFTIAQGKLEFFPAILAGIIGTVAGGFVWYYAGVFFSEARLERLADRYGKWISVSSKDIQKANHWFNRHGVKAVFLCRLVPGVRTLISLPAGLNNMALIPFTFYSTLGTALWVSFLTYAGYKLGDHYEDVEKYIGPFSKIALLSLAIWFVIWVIRKQLRRQNG